MSETAHGAPEGNPADDPVVEVRNASVRFDMSRGTSQVLDDVSLDVERGEVLGVVGESGSGKSMFASAFLDAVVEPGQLTGEITYHPESGGEVDVLGLSDEELRELRWEGISMVFQGAQSSFDPTMKIGEHFRETLDAHDYDEDAGMDRGRELLNDLYLEPDRVFDSYPHELSGGMQQRALIALSLILEPEVLVLDEPTAALDLLMQRSIIALLDTLRDEYNLTMVFITHDLPLGAELSDRLAVMYAFEFAEVGPADELITDAKHPYTRALINSTPNLDTPVEMMRPIEGESPDAVNVPNGCSYHPRCPMSDEQCVEVDPEMYSVDADHQAACHYWERTDDEVPLSITEYRVGDGETDIRSQPTPGSTGESSDVVLSLDDVEVHFDESQDFLEGLFNEPNKVKAVDGVSLDIYENDVVALVGESGCGKTTLGKTAIGAQRPTGGTVSYEGQDIWEAKETADTEVPFDEIRRALQIIHQDPESSLTPHKTVRSTLARPLKIWHPDLQTEDREARIYGMLERVGMKPASDYANRYPHQLSGGEAQRVALVRSLLMNPSLILADEAVSALDVSLRVDVMDLLLDLQEEFGTSFLFISHNLSNARYLAEKADGRIGIMYLGELVEIGPVNEVLENPQHPYTKVLKWATANLNPDQSAVEEPPVREIDIPDPLDPPSGCRFHTRCPEAREVCTRETPQLHEAGSGDEQAACFRVYGEDHEYWDSEPLGEEGELTAALDTDRETADSAGD